MSTYLFAWNPNKWTWHDLPQAVYEANGEGFYREEWACVSTRQISPGDRAFLMRLGVKPKGIMGSGVVTSKPVEGLHWDPDRAAEGDTIFRVEIVFDVLSDLPILGEETLTIGDLSQHDWFPQASGTKIPDDIAETLENLWTSATGTTFIPPEPDELVSLHTEGARRSRVITTYERNHKARDRCIEHHGTRCKVCNVSFEEQYGSLGKGFIHVHHVVPVSLIGEEYIVDPISDLAPVCPNCHAMLHKKTPPHTIDELKQLLINTNSVS